MFNQRLRKESMTKKVKVIARDGIADFRARFPERTDAYCMI